MSNFWSQRLAPAAQPQQAPAAPQPASTAPWWLPQTVAPVQPQQPAQTVQQTVVPTPQQASVAPDGKAHFGDLLQQDGYTTEKAQSAKDSTTCPDCGSPNYMGVKGSPNAMKQCFECGFNPRFAHSTAGASGIGQQNVAAPRPARVQNVATGAPPMGTVIGHA